MHAMTIYCLQSKEVRLSVPEKLPFCLIEGRRGKGKMRCLKAIVLPVLQISFPFAEAKRKFVSAGVCIQLYIP